MTPEEAQARYEAEWPALNAAKEAAVARGDVKEAKGCRQALSELSKRYAARHVPPPQEPTEIESLRQRVKDLEDWKEWKESLGKPNE